MRRGGWRELVRNWNWARGEGHYPIAAYSEFMPAPWVGEKPYGTSELRLPFSQAAPSRWTISEREQKDELAPGLANIGRQIIETLVALATGNGPHRIGRAHLEHNPYWPNGLAQAAEALKREHFLFLSPLALSKTQDDKGRVRWTLFGGSEQGPAKGFWQSFFMDSAEIPAERAFDSLRTILSETFAESQLGDLKRAGLRVLPSGPVPGLFNAEDGALPKWTLAFLLANGELDEGARYLLTFRPFEFLPQPIKSAYLSGTLHLLPSPASLVFWGSPLYRKLAAELPLAIQIPLISAIAHHESPTCIRVPQAGWFHEPHPEKPAHDERLGHQAQTVRRSHRWERVHRDDEVEPAHEDHVRTALFSTAPKDVDLYGKPMARNAQIWSSDFRALLNGPSANGEDIRKAGQELDRGGSFGYRFFYPPMQLGRYAVTWHRPLAAFRDRTGAAKIIDCGLSGFMTAADARTFKSRDGAAWWPVLAPAEADTADIMPKRFGPAAAEAAKRAPALTFPKTATREFELKYWKTIAALAEGRYLNKNNADCVNDRATEARLSYPERDLETLGDYLLKYYRGLAAETGMAKNVSVGEHRFSWKTDFEFPWMGGWLDNQSGKKHERNLVVVIPGKNRAEAIVMADHYDTAYMEDIYGYGDNPHGDGSRVAAAGADDNHSATAALMLAAPIFFELSRKKRLERDIWLVHLTGEEFPSDCLGARHLAQSLVEGSLKIRTAKDRVLDLKSTRVRGLYVLDMIAHNNDRHRDILQIAPGNDEGSLWLAYQASIAGALWNDGTALWNARPARRGLGRARRSPHGGAVPKAGQHLPLKGEVRPHDNPRSTLFNTDGQIFSDAGIPTVLFMENYDINRTGYHDSRDTMANIDLDYGAALSAIAIESVARAATLAVPGKI